MEALVFLNEYKRMCESTGGGCAVCPMSTGNNKHNVTCSHLLTKCPEDACKIVEQWSKEHPIITNAMKFKEVFGHKPQSINGIIFCPPVTPGAFECDRVDCMKCLEWWDKQYKEPENA